MKKERAECGRSSANGKHGIIIYGHGLANEVCFKTGGASQFYSLALVCDRHQGSRCVHTFDLCSMPKATEHRWKTFLLMANDMARKFHVCLTTICGRQAAHVWVCRCTCDISRCSLSSHLVNTSFDAKSYEVSDMRLHCSNNIICCCLASLTY